MIENQLPLCKTQYLSQTTCTCVHVIALIFPDTIVLFPLLSATSGQSTSSPLVLPAELKYRPLQAANCVGTA